MVDSVRPAALLGSAVVATTAVVGLVGVLILGFGRGGDDAQVPAAALAAAQAPPTVGGVQTEAAAVPGPLDSPPAAPADQPSPVPSEPQAAPSTSVIALSAADKRRSPVVILNQTGRGGLAASFRAQLRESEWTVRAVGDWVGNVPATTVYYPRGMKDAARALMAEFSQVGRIRPSFAGVPDDALTVILAGDFRRG
ncbi:MAG: LytR C-terminal domain-containing protein [Sporichthyaceae bacterium]